MRSLCFATRFFTETLPSRTSNTIRWSPRGRHVVLSTVGSSSKSELEFWDMDFHSTDEGTRTGGPTGKEEWGSGIQMLGTADHYGVTDVEWDPSGRYLATSASVWRHTVRDAITQLISQMGCCRARRIWCECTLFLSQDAAPFDFFFVLRSSIDCGQMLMKFEFIDAARWKTDTQSGTSEDKR